ncbi:OLC1v1001660C1 [Oldenlandia corymbosa var. corymbosa]|uniref:E3 ubiquitin-protein ligase RMA n=1 Tax=Oldenlandia corymbosa var. corymbosa TaxID=529605 RepID=A0AAV1D978_OLDCO|nr:OLC1v1001660C1 [Oldenlandia corymbosa var. corymbosa]
MEGSVLDQSLDQQPLNQLVGSASNLVGDQICDLETGDGAIKERFRHLKAAAVRAGLSMGRWSNRNIVETGASFVGPVADRNVNRGMWGGVEGGGADHSIAQRGKGCKRKSSCLVAMALEMSSDVSTVQESRGNFYDCNICLNIAREPILTCCGHLFCWACFSKLPYANSFARDCPVCEGEVTDSSIVPIYGDGDSARNSSLDSSITIPPRPKAQRVESERQQRVALGISHIHVPVAEALRRLRTSVSTSTMGENSPAEREGFQVWRTSRFTRELSENAAALVSLINVERLLEDLETYVNNRQL